MPAPGSAVMGMRHRRVPCAVGSRTAAAWVVATGDGPVVLSERRNTQCSRASRSVSRCPAEARAPPRSAAGPEHLSAAHEGRVHDDQKVALGRRVVEWRTKEPCKEGAMREARIVRKGEGEVYERLWKFKEGSLTGGR